MAFNVDVYQGDNLPAYGQKGTKPANVCQHFNDLVVYSDMKISEPIRFEQACEDVAELLALEISIADMCQRVTQLFYPHCAPRNVWQFKDLGLSYTDARWEAEYIPIPQIRWFFKTKGEPTTFKGTGWNKKKAQEKALDKFILQLKSFTH